jgi:hypothetical protein
MLGDSRTSSIPGILYQQKINTTLLTYRNCWQTTRLDHARNSPDTHALKPQQNAPLILCIILRSQFTHTKHFRLLNILTVIMANFVSQLFPARVGMKRSLLLIRRGL